MKFDDENHKKHGKHAMPRKKHKALRVVTAIACVLVLCVGAYMLWEKPPETSKPEVPDIENQESGSGRKDGVYTLLVVGRDKSGANTDTLLVGRMDTVLHTLNVVSIPRDTLVNTPGNVKKVNTLFAFDLNNGGNGVDGLVSGIKDLVGFTVDCYAVVDLTAFEKLVDTIGGVRYNVPFDMDYDDPDQNLHIHFKAGEQLLNGEDALRVVRFRKGNPGSGYTGNGGDISRIERQQGFLSAVAKQTLTAGNIANLGKLTDIFIEYVDTDLTAANLSFFAREFLLCKPENVSFHTLPGNYGDSVGGFSYVSIFVDEWLTMVNDCLNPLNAAITVDDVDILTRDASGALWATGGKIAGGVDSFLTMEEYLASIGAGSKPKPPEETPAPSSTPELPPTPPPEQSPPPEAEVSPDLPEPEATPALPTP
ncbi:MAG: LCP family protein [Oscillospiraceae bacterium]